MKFAFSSNAFRKFSIVETIGILSGIGYEGIEIMADVPHAYPPDLTEDDIIDIRKALDRHGLAVTNINAFMMHAEGDTWHPSWIEKDPALRKRRVDHTLRCIELARSLGAPSLSTEPGGPLDGMEPEKGYNLFMEGLLVVQAEAKKQGIRILIEPEPDLLIENSSQFQSFMKGLDPEVFGLNFDIGHFYCVGEDPEVLVRSLKDSICHFHLEDIASTRIHYHLIPGYGAIDLKGVLKAIGDIGYAGFVTVELYPYEDHPIDAAEKALHYLRGL